MRIHLCGQRYFGQEALELLIRMKHDVVCVSAPPEHGDEEDRLWKRAGLHGVPRMKAGELNASTIADGVDLIVCAHSHDFVGRGTRLRTRYGAIGYHPSLLPLHRGRDAVRWTVRMHEQVAGGSVYWLNDRVDGGPIAAQDWCFVRRGDTASELWRRELQPMGLRLLEHVLRDVAAGRIVAVPQDETLATWEPSFDPPALRRPDLPLLRASNEDGDREQTVLKLDRSIRPRGTGETREATE